MTGYSSGRLRFLSSELVRPGFVEAGCFGPGRDGRSTVAKVPVISATAAWRIAAVGAGCGRVADSGHQCRVIGQSRLSDHCTDTSAQDHIGDIRVVRTSNFHHCF